MLPQFLALCVACLGATGVGAAASCTMVNGTVLGSQCKHIQGGCTLENMACSSAAKCCSLCQGHSGCTAWTFEPRPDGTHEVSGGSCFLKNSTAGQEGRAGAVSGCISASDCPSPPPPAQAHVTVHIDTGAILSQTDTGFKCWNIDASPNREWETRDLSSPLLASLGRQSLPGYLRFGGSGNDGLPYALDMPDLSSLGNRCAPGSRRCLNRTWTDNLANFAKKSGAKLVFGLNVFICPGATGRDCKGQTWDPTEAKALMQYLIKANHTIYGFELGNEQNTNYLPHKAASNFKILSDLLAELWPNASNRPKVIGPDVHGFHGDPRTSAPEKPKLKYLREFAPNCSLLGVPLHAVTHHECEYTPRATPCRGVSQASLAYRARF